MRETEVRVISKHKDKTFPAERCRGTLYIHSCAANSSSSTEDGIG